VSARPEEEPLVLRVARGTTVLGDHESALVELCSDPTLDSKEAEECIVEFLKEGYYMDDETIEEQSIDVESELVEQVDEKEQDVVDEDAIVADMYSMWAEEMDDLVRPPDSQEVQQEDNSSKPSVKPWSSRSSQSGTFVRDPKTGVMRNIDA
jgi:hypothetical protein